ncbi:odorant receptor Or1-like isoform X2 [Megalopta genalis]|uniref:odorant receptor Or1-like isoform X2 n=1 Tax=Megalopta genalis TaxID=115081 RepID=UPI003FD6947A
MPTLTWASMVLTMIGCRHPPTWTSKTKMILYKAYALLVLFLVQSLTLSSIMDLAINVKDQNEFGDNLYLTMPMVIATCKLCSLLANRNSIAILMTATQRKPYLPIDDKETKIETSFDVTNEDPKNRVLAYRAWIPYNYYSSLVLYSVTYAHQALSLIIGSLINVGFDSLFSGLILSICSQLEILGHRLQNIQNDTQSARECARHHDFIYKFATKMNEDFQTVLLVQFLSSMTISCFCLYRITQTELGDRLPETMVYAVCFLFQLFFYCWYGNEVRLKSLEIPDMIFASNWESLNQNTKSTLLMIMLRATFPIEFTSAYVLAVNLKAFMMVIKTSYSAYNLLQGS